MQRYQFTKIDSILSKYHRDFKGLNVEEGDAIEWIGEALGFIKQVGASEEAVAFLEVRNYQTQIPNGLHYITQVARYNRWEDNTIDCTPKAIIEELAPTPTSGCASCNEYPNNLVPVDCDGEIMGDYEVAYYRPFFDLKYEYGDWACSNYRRQNFTPVRLADNTFFNSVVCKEKDMSIYHSCRDEYTVVQDHLRFSFKDGFIALAYVRQMIDESTGYPMIPDDESAKAAITYYMTWKIKQRDWIVNNRESSERQAASMEAHWLKYKKQFSAKTKMPGSLDDLQDLMEQSTYLLPRRRDYYGFFGKLTEPEIRPHFNDRGRFRAYRGI